jgi:hypothetical protein
MVIQKSACADEAKPRIGWASPLFETLQMSDAYIVADSFAGLPEASRHRLRTLLDAADSANPHQEPLFFGGRESGEVNLLVERDGRPVFYALGFENPALTRFLPSLKSLIVQKGPVADDTDALLSGLRALSELARRRGLCEIHINPQIHDRKTRDVERICGAQGFRPAASLSPGSTLRLDVTREFDQILAGFHPAWRYNLKRASRIGITVRRAETVADFFAFYEIHKQRALHKGFLPLPIDHFTTLSERMRTAPERSALFFSEFRGDVLAGDIFLRAGPRIHGVYAAISKAGVGNLPRLYPIFGRAIQWAKEIGCTEIDFGGYGPSGDPSVRQFKKGFGGEVTTFVPAYSLTLRPIIPYLRRIARRVAS